MGKKKKKDFTYNWKTPKSFLRSFWHLVWEDDSLLGWIANIFFAFIVIKFLLFPGLGLIFGTEFPIVAVVSSSMEHDGSFDEWWNSKACSPAQPCTQGQWYESRNISKQTFQTFPFKNGFNKGDVMVLFGVKPDNINLGDVIVYNSMRKYPIIHRVINIDNNVFQTKGDHNPLMIQDYIAMDQRGRFYDCYIEYEEQIKFTSCSTFGAQKITSDIPGAIKDLDEYNIQGDEVYGRAVLKIPFIGWVKIWAVDVISWIIQLFV